MRATLVLLLTALTAAAGPKPGDEGTAEYEKAAELVRQLGHPRFAVREAAGKKLIEMGAAAIPALTAGTKATDEEVRTRSLALLPQVKAAGWKRRADAFLADPTGQRDLPLLVEWEKLTGKPDAGSRKLYAEMIQANGDLLEQAAADPKAVADALRARCRAILNEVRVGRGQVKARVGDLAALFFVHQRTVPDRAEWDSDHPAHLLGNPGLGEGLKAKDVGPALGRLLAAWADSRPADDPVSHQCFALAVGQAPFPEAAPVLTRLARDPKAQPLNVRALAVSALGKVGDGPALEALGELITDSTPLYQAADEQLGDHALAVLIAARNKEPADFGLTQVLQCRFRAGPRGTAVDLEFRTFEGNDHRARGLKKWKDEAAKKDR